MGWKSSAAGSGKLMRVTEIYKSAEEGTGSIASEGNKHCIKTKM